MHSSVSSLINELFAEGNKWRVPISILASYSKRAKAAKEEEDFSDVIIPFIERIKTAIRKSRYPQHQKEMFILHMNTRKEKYLKWLRGR